MQAKSEVHVRAHSQHTIQAARITKVSIPRLPWGADVLESPGRDETKPDARITLCNRIKRKHDTLLYTLVRKAMEELRHEVDQGGY